MIPPLVTVLCRRAIKKTDDIVDPAFGIAADDIGAAGDIVSVRRNQTP